MSKLENNVVTPQALPFYDRYVDDIFTKKSKNESDKLLESMNSYHKNINFTVEENPIVLIRSYISPKTLFQLQCSENPVNCQYIGRHKYPETGRKMQF